MWLCVRLLTTVLSFAQDGSVGKGTPSGADVDRSSTGKIQAREFEQPAVGVPCPTCDWAIDQCSPEKGEHEGGNDAATFEGTTNHDLDRASTEHELVEAEDNFWNVGATDGGGDSDILHAEVCKVTDEGSGCTRVGKGVSLV